MKNKSHSTQEADSTAAKLQHNWPGSIILSSVIFKLSFNQLCFSGSNTFRQTKATRKLLVIIYTQIFICLKLNSSNWCILILKNVHSHNNNSKTWGCLHLWPDAWMYPPYTNRLRICCKPLEPLIDEIEALLCWPAPVRPWRSCQIWHQRFVAYDFLEVDCTLQTSRTNN